MQSTDRDALRQRMQLIRKKLPAEQIKHRSSLIITYLERIDCLREARTIMAYYSINNEVDLFPFLDKQLRSPENKRVLLPRVGKNNLLQAVELTDWAATRRGPFGIPEPLGKCFDVAQIDVVLVPGLVFDQKGYRLGYGRGYYDRFLKLLSPHTFLCGICYAFQVVEHVFPTENDVPVHWIITERLQMQIM